MKKPFSELLLGGDLRRLPKLHPDRFAEFGVIVSALERESIPSLQARIRKLKRLLILS